MKILRKTILIWRPKIDICLRNNIIHTTADPTATPPAVAAIWPNIEGCCGWAVIGAAADGGAWAGTRLGAGAGAALQ